MGIVMLKGLYAEETCRCRFYGLSLYDVYRAESMGHSVHLYHSVTAAGGFRG